MKKITSFLLTILFILNISVVAVGASTEIQNNEVESNNSFQQAQVVEENEVIHGSIYEEDVVDFFKITLKKRQRVTMYTLGTHYENYFKATEYGAIAESLAFDIYRKNTGKYSPFTYSKIDKETCYYSFDYKYEDFEVEYDGFVVDDEKWEQTEDMVLDAGTYYFAFKFDSLNKSQNYKFMYKLGDPVPAIYNKYHSDEFNLKYKSVSAGDYLHLRVRDGEVTNWASENNKIAKVNKNGKVTALQKGTTNIIATLSNGKKLKCTLTVTSDPVLKINNKNTKSITLNKGKKITVTIKGKAVNIKNKYTDTKIAKITGKTTAKKFTVKALAKGTTTLKIKVNGVKTLKLKVTVK